MKVTTNMVRCADESPKSRGDYLVVYRLRDGTREMRVLEYNPAYGWNTHRRSDGFVLDKYRIMFEERDDAWWSEIVLEEGGESNE